MGSLVEKLLRTQVLERTALMSGSSGFAVKTLGGGNGGGEVRSGKEECCAGLA